VIQGRGGTRLKKSQVVCVASGSPRAYLGPNQTWFPPVIASSATIAPPRQPPQVVIVVMPLRVTAGESAQPSTRSHVSMTDMVEGNSPRREVNPPRSGLTDSPVPCIASTAIVRDGPPGS